MNDEKEIKKKTMQINYFIIHYIWKKADETAKMVDMYAILDIGRNRFKRAIDYGSIRVTKEKGKALEIQTGLQRGIFTGDVLFSINGISKDVWLKYIELKNEITKSIYKDNHCNNHHIALKIDLKKIKELEEQENFIKGKLDKIEDQKNVDFQKLIHYIRNKSADQRTITESKIDSITSQIQSLDFRQIKSCEDVTLDKYANIIKKQYLMLETLLKYRKYNK